MCVARFIEPYKLKLHLKQMHECSVCEKCGVTINHKVKGNHICNDEFVKKRPQFVCKICKPEIKEYQRRGYLIRHLESVHLASSDKLEKSRAREELEENKTAEKLIEDSARSGSEERNEQEDYDKHREDLRVRQDFLKTSLTKSDTSTGTKDFYELEINLEYDLISKLGGESAFGLPQKTSKTDFFSGTIKLPKSFARNLTNNQMFGEINLDTKKFLSPLSHLTGGKS